AFVASRPRPVARQHPAEGKNARRIRAFRQGRARGGSHETRRHHAARIVVGAAMPYPQITEYHEAVQHPQLAFVDPELKQGTVAENNLGLPMVMSGGFALTYAVTTVRRKCAVRCFHREIPAIQQKYDAIAKKLRLLTGGYFVDFDFQQSGIRVRQA